MTVAYPPEKTRRGQTQVHTRAPERKGASPEELPWVGGLFRRAFIGTDRGTAGILWRAADCGDAPFSHGVADGLLSRILLPGDTQTELRRKLRPAIGEVTEVFLSTNVGNRRGDRVPLWVWALVEMLQEAFSDAIKVADFREPGGMWEAWEPCLDFSGKSVFQKRVLGIVGRIPRGSTMTYGEVARKAGNEHGARAVGMVMRTNPWPILVPCHRVVGSTGKMTGFSAPGGVETKRQLLLREKTRLFAAQAG